MNNEPPKFARSLYEKSLLTMILVLALRSSVQEDVQIKTNKKKHVVMDDIFIYIREHLTEDISLERLENEFYVSRYHIVREFKKMTGETPHSYIVKSRLDLCRHYIEQGKSIREVYALGGFGGYNHFFRAFKKNMVLLQCNITIIYRLTGMKSNDCVCRTKQISPQLSGLKI